MTEKDTDLRDVFKYKKFRFSPDNSIIYFDLTRVFKNDEFLGEYFVKNNNGDFVMTFNPLHLGPFENIWVITEKGDKILLNQYTPQLMSGDTITLTQVSEEEIPDDIKEKLDQLYEL